MASWNGTIGAAAAQAEFAAAPTSDKGSRSAMLAREALKQDATATDALNVLGFQAQLRGDTDQAARVFDYSLALSRREPQARLWAIEEAVGRGDVGGALAQYDLALRTSRASLPTLFPILTAALSQPLVRRHLLELLKTDPAWSASFLAFAARNSGTPQNVVRLFLEGAATGLKVAPGDHAAVVNALAARDDYVQAWDYYRQINPNASRTASRDRSFTNELVEPSVFDWTSVEQDGRTASFDHEAGGVSFSSPASVGGIVLRQMQILPVGRYRIAGSAQGIDQPEPSRPYWSLSCLDGRELGRVLLPASTEREARFAGELSVPNGCPVQVLALVLRPADGLAGVSGRVVSTRLAALAGR